MGTRVSEIKSKSDVETEWRWIPTDCNLADMGTRADVKPSDMGEESDYQLGMPWMRLPVEEWPAKKDVNKRPPVEEMRKPVVEATCNVVAQQESLVKYSGSYSKLLRIWGYVFTFIGKCKKMEVVGLQVATGKDGHSVHSSPTPDMLQAAEDFLMEDAQKNLDKKKLESLMPLKKEFMDSVGIKRVHLVVGGRLVKKLHVGYDKNDLPILDYQHPLANMVMEDAHGQDHGGQNNAVLRSRKLVWIVKARKLAMKIKNNCFRCRLLYKRCMEQKMGPMPDHRLGPAPIFHSTAVDLFGPLQIRDAVKKRTTGKCWGVLFTCTVTSAVCLELTESYSMDSFLQALVRFTCAHGMPARFQSDAGDQLVAAAKQVGTWDYTRILEWCGEKKTTWQVVPVGAQHHNGLAERLIGMAKLCLEQVLHGKVCTFGEMATMLKEAEYMLNSRPLAVKPGADPEEMGPITPLHLMSGRSSMHLPGIKFEENVSLTRRLQFLQEVRDQFWEKWISLWFGKMVPAGRWRKEFPDLKEGDVVLMKDESLVAKDYRLGRVKTVYPGDDGHVRRADIEYRNPNEKDFRVTQRPIQKLIIVVPVQ